MSFWVLFFAAFLERFVLVESLLQREALFNAYLSSSSRFIPFAWRKQPYGILLIMAPALSLVAGLHWIVEYLMSGVLLFLVDVTTLLYCLGPTSVYYREDDALEDLFEKVHSGLFTVLFSFALLGATGALLFRLIERIASSHQSDNVNIEDSIVSVSKMLVEYYSWLPVRFFIGIQSIASRFPDTLKYWLDHLLTGPNYNRELARQSGAIALSMSAEDPLDYKDYRNAKRLFDKMLIIFLGMMLVYALLSMII